MHKLGFSRSFLRWTLSYLSGRSQYVNIDSNSSSSLSMHFGVPQGSILGPILFNLYANDLDDSLSSHSLQYADDTTIYEHSKPSSITQTETKLNDSLTNLLSWTQANQLATNSLKTHYMICSTPALSRIHKLDDHTSNVEMNNHQLPRTSHNKVLGITLDDKLKWDNHVSQVISSCYGILAILKKLKNFSNFKLRKHLVESLVLSKIDYCDYVYSVNATQLKKLQRLQIVGCSFVIGHYAKIDDVFKLRWLPVEKRRIFNTAKIAYKSINNMTSAAAFHLKLKENRRTLRNNNTVTLQSDRISGTFQDTASIAFNSLPVEIRSADTYSNFCRKAKIHLLNTNATNLH